MKLTVNYSLRRTVNRFLDSESYRVNNQYDVVVIGAGPGGGSAATIVAEAGYKTLLIEREAVPRYHIGESLMPEVYWPLQRLGMLDRMRAAGYVVKNSVQFVSANGKESDPFFFREHDDRECSATWQVERSKFDEMLFQRAAELGADCVDRTRLLDVHFDGDRATGVRVRDAEGQEHNIAAQVVIDATGQQSFIANKLNLKEVNPELKKIAIWRYYENARRDPGENDGATIILQTTHKDSWFWFIPLSNGITSIGCVGDRDFMLGGRGTPAEVFDEELAQCPGLMARLEDATQVGNVRTTKEFSYWTTRHAGDGWVLVGDAFGFIDPVYSSGVYFALEMGVRAGDAVVAGLAAGDTSAAQLGSWTDEFKSGTQWLRKLVNVFYTKEFSVGRFLRDYPQHRGNLTDLLIGRIFYDGAGKIFDDLEPALQQAVSETKM